MTDIKRPESIGQAHRIMIQMQARIDELEGWKILKEKLSDSTMRSMIAENQELQDNIIRLNGAIQKWLDGDYPNPRTNRPHDCLHGTAYWESCEDCETDYWASVLTPKEPEE